MARYIPNIKFIPLAEEAREHGWSSFIEAAKRQLLGGSPIISTWENFRGWDHFYKKEVDDKDFWRLAYHRWLPNIPIIPKSYGFDRIEKAARGEPRAFRDTPESPSQASNAAWWSLRDVTFTVQQLERVGGAHLTKRLKTIKEKLKEAQYEAYKNTKTIRNNTSEIRLMMDQGDIEAKRESANRSFYKATQRFERALSVIKRNHRTEFEAARIAKRPVENIPEGALANLRSLLVDMYIGAENDAKRKVVGVLDELMAIQIDEMNRLDIPNLRAVLEYHKNN